jgi:hypothetical protein
MIAERYYSLNPDKAYVMRPINDIGRRYGISPRRHSTDGYNFVMEKGWNEEG